MLHQNYLVVKNFLNRYNKKKRGALPHPNEGNRMSDIIAAVATGWQTSAIGIIRMSGSGCIEIAKQVFKPRFGSVDTAKDRSLIIGHLFDKQGRLIDEVLLTISHGPNSYTGEDTAEFQCHGSPAVLTAGLDSLFA